MALPRPPLLPRTSPRPPAAPLADAPAPVLRRVGAPAQRELPLRPRR